MPFQVMLHHVIKFCLAFAALASARTDHGLPGYGISFFHPYCANACRDAVSSAALSCSEIMSGDEPMTMTSPECFATDDVFLQTLAWCISTRCLHEPTWNLEKYWQMNVAGTADIQPDPKESYQTSLAHINSTPTATYSQTGSLNKTSVIAESLWFAAYNNDRVVDEQESMQEKYGLVILLSGFIVPIAFSMLRFAPVPGVWRSKFHAWLIDPPLFSPKHDTPILFGLAQMPKRGQGLFILYFIVLNTVLSAVNYEYANPNTWYPGDKTRWMELLIGNRLGVLSFANMPLMFLYAGRNNLLLWVTDWPHSTFLLLHKWIAAIATLQAILHSLIYLVAYVKAGTHDTEAKLPYWYWGIIATVGMTVLFPTSIFPLRRKFYELFLAWHVAISILVVAGCYWHILFKFKHNWGYETWIWVCMAVWGFDRAFRILRILRYGVKRAHITALDAEYAKVVIPNVPASGCAYLYFPTLTWRVWENHPFSVASTIIPSVADAGRRRSSLSSHSDVEKAPRTTSLPAQEPPSAIANTQSASSPNTSFDTGLTFYIRTQAGLTSLLRSHATLPVLVEAGYKSHALSSAPKLVVIAGGVGITAAFPHLQSHRGLARLYWACRSQGLVDDVRASGVLSGVEEQIFVGERMAVREVLKGELVGARGRVCVFVCGPSGMIDAVRDGVVDVVRKGRGIDVKLVVESFSW